MLTTINYNDGCEKTINIHKYYNTKTSDIYKTVKFRYPNNTTSCCMKSRDGKCVRFHMK